MTMDNASTANRLAVLEHNQHVLTDTLAIFSEQIVDIRRDALVSQKVLMAIVASEANSGRLDFQKIRELALRSDHPISETQEKIEALLAMMEGMLSASPRQ